MPFYPSDIGRCGAPLLSCKEAERSRLDMESIGDLILNIQPWKLWEININYL